MRNLQKISAVSGFALFVGAFLAQTAFAATELISPIPGFETTAGTDLGSYLKAIFSYGIGLAALLAMAQLIFGAVQYTTSAGAPSLQEDAKGRMRSAIIGLVLLILSISILTIVLRPSNTLSPEVEALLNERERQLKRAEGNAAAFREKIVAETLHMGTVGEAAEYLLQQAIRTSDMAYFTKEYGADSAIDARNEYAKAFREALLKLKGELTGSQFEAATSKFPVAEWLE
jgi:uncharacterized membrane protein